MPDPGEAGRGTAVGARDRIARAAGDLLDAGGPAAVTMRAVADRAGLSPMAAYRHYRDRQAILQLLADAAFAELAERFARPREGGVLAELHGMLDDLLDLALDRPHLYALAFTDRRDEARVLPGQVAQSPTLRIVIAALERGMSDGTLRRDDPAEVALGFAGLVQGLWLSRHAGRMPLPDKDFRQLCHRSADRMIEGLRSPAR